VAQIVRCPPGGLPSYLSFYITHMTVWQISHKTIAAEATTVAK